MESQSIYWYMDSDCSGGSSEGSYISLQWANASPSHWLQRVCMMHGA